MNVKLHLILAFICIYQMMNDVPYLFMCLMANCISFLDKYLFKSLAQILIGFCLFTVEL